MAGIVVLPVNSSFAVIPAPTITGFTPASGPVGTGVTVTGTDLTGATLVKFYGVSAVFSAVSATEITAVVPAGATSGQIKITTAGGTAASMTSFTVIPAPTIVAFGPFSGPVGTLVTLYGDNLRGATEVTFNGTAATRFDLVSATQIKATVPDGATTGTIAVTTPGGTATSAASFTVVPPPRLTRFTPTSGPVGIRVVLTGTDLIGATSVEFHGVSAVFGVISPTQITTVVPAGATSGPIGVTTVCGAATSTMGFTVTVPLSPATVTLKLIGLKRGAVTLGRWVTADGGVRPAKLIGSTVTLMVQKKKGTEWVKLTTASATISATAAYRWKYKPAGRGAYRIRAAIAKTTTTLAARTPWREFQVK